MISTIITVVRRCCVATIHRDVSNVNHLQEEGYAPVQ